MTALKIGEVARRADVGIETIRYYERQGLLAEPQRRPSGYRQYDEAVVSRLRFIRHTKELGFTLNEIKELLGLWFNRHTRCEHVRALSERKIADIGEKVRLLNKMKRSLKQIIKQCTDRNQVDQCPLWLGLDESKSSSE